MATTCRFFVPSQTSIDEDGTSLPEDYRFDRAQSNPWCLHPKNDLRECPYEGSPNCNIYQPDPGLQVGELTTADTKYAVFVTRIDGGYEIGQIRNGEDVILQVEVTDGKFSRKELLDLVKAAAQKEFGDNITLVEGRLVHRRPLLPLLVE